MSHRTQFCRVFFFFLARGCAIAASQLELAQSLADPVVRTVVSDTADSITAQQPAAVLKKASLTEEGHFGNTISQISTTTYLRQPSRLGTAVVAIKSEIRVVESLKREHTKIQQNFIGVTWHYEVYTSLSNALEIRITLPFCVSNAPERSVRNVFR